MNPMPKQAYECTECKQIYLTQESAKNCCKPYYCDICNAPTRRYVLRCKICQDKIKFDKARKLTPEEYNSEFPGNMIYSEYTYYLSMDDLLECYGCDSKILPSYCYGTNKMKLKLDIEYALKMEEENAERAVTFSEDAYKYAKFFEEIFNKQYVKTYYLVNKNIIILLDSENK